MNVQQWQLQHANERASAATTEAVHSMPRALSVLRHLAQETHRMLQTPAMAAATCIDDGAVTCGALTCNPTTAYAQPCCGRRMH